jgi:poly-gamma-glutamate capsule biosynthesis protein CapA/YwtB (metallophosphatase superfamily)
MARVGGIDVVSVANNHSLDYGPDAFLDTLRHARAAGIAPVGGGSTGAHARRPVLVERGGLRIAFLAYSDVNPLGFPAGPSSPGTARADPDALTADVRAARRRADVVVCWFHWGDELRAEPTAEQERLAAAALSGGAHVVLGAHPHVLGAVSVPRRGALVAWTLGNFVFPSYRAETVRTAVLVVRLDARGVRGHDVLPHRIEEFRPAPVPAGAE